MKAGEIAQGSHTCLDMPPCRPDSSGVCPNCGGQQARKETQVSKDYSELIARVRDDLQKWNPNPVNVLAIADALEEVQRERDRYQKRVVELERELGATRGALFEEIMGEPGAFGP